MGRTALIAALTFCPLLGGIALGQTVSTLPADVLTIGHGTLASSSPLGTMTDPATGNVYIMDSANYKVYIYNPVTGFNTTPWLTTTTSAATGCTDTIGDGCALSSAYDVRPYGMAIDSSGNIYLADNSHTDVHVVIGPNGPGTVLTALLTALGVKPLTGTAYLPGYMYLVAGGGKETTADASSGFYCGTGSATAPSSGSQAKPVNSLGDGCLATAIHSFGTSSPRGIGVDGYGNIYVSDYEDDAIRMIVANPMTITGNPVSGVLPVGTITTIAGLGTIGGGATAGTVGGYCSGSSGPTMTDIAGDGCLGSQIALGTISSGYPWGVSSDRFGNVYITDTYQLEGKSGMNTTATQGLVRKLTPSTPPIANSTVSYTITDIAGLPPGLTNAICSNAYDSVGDGCNALNATVNVPRGVTTDLAGNVYFSDWSNNMTRRIDATTGVITEVAGEAGITANPTTYCATVAGSPNTPLSTSPVPADAYGAGCLGIEIFEHNPQGQPSVDAQGNVYVIDSSEGAVSKMAQYPDFSARATGTTATAVPLGVVFEAGDTPATTGAFATGTSEYSVTPIACLNTANTGGAQAYLSSNSTLCHLSATFTPVLPGTRNASLLVTDTAAPAAISNFSLQGAGTGVTLGIDPATTATLGSGWSMPTGIATDAAGNVYAADANNSSVVRITGSTLTPVTSGLSLPGPVAVAANGNVYVADSANLYVVPASGSGYGSKTAISTAVSAPKGLAIDMNGNLYVADTGHSQVLEFPSDNGSPGGATSFALTTTGVTLSGPTGLATDAAGDLFIANAGGSQIVELPVNSTTASVVASGISALTGLAVDPAGDIYYAQSTGAVGVIYAGTTTAITLYSSAAKDAASIALDGNGNLYIADATTPAVTELLRSTGALDFGSLAVYGTSSPQTATVTSTGNANLLLTSAAQSDTADFNIAPAASLGCVYGQSYTPGSFCAYTAEFTPANNIALSDVVSFTSNAINSTMPTLTATGTGTGSVKPRAAIALSSTPASPVYGQTVTAMAVVTPASGSGTPTGSVLFSVDGGTGVSQTIVSGTATYAITGLTAGAHTITANYAGDTNFGSAPQQQISVTVAQAAPVIGWTPSALTQTYGTAISTAVLDATTTNSVAGSFAYTAKLGAGSPFALTAGTIILDVGSYTITATFTPTDTVDYSSPSTTITYTVTQATPVISWSPSASTQIYGTAIGSGVLNASITGTEGGSLSYTAKPTVGSAVTITATSVLAVSSYTITVTFTPTNTTDYTTATQSSPYSVTQAVPAITWLPSTGTQAYGTAIGSAVLDATVASPAGTLAYTSKLGTGSPVALTSATVLNTGSYTLTATFTPTDTVDYAVATAQQSYVVTKAVPAVMLSATSTTFAVNTVDAITASVSLSGGVAASTGQVQFFDGTTPLASVELVGSSPASGQTTGTAVLKKRFSHGNHSITATYIGPYANFQPATSPALPLTVTGTTTSSTTLSATADVANPANYDFTGTVTGSGVPAPSASLNINDVTAGNTSVGTIVLSSPASTFTALLPGFTTGSAPDAILRADFDNDGIADFAVANSGANTVTVVLGASLSSPVTKTTNVGNAPSALAVGDFNGDGIPDIAVANKGDNTVGILLGKGDGTFQTMVPYTAGRAPSSIAVGDINQDGVLDIVVSNATDGTVSVLLGNGDGTFSAQTVYTAGSSPQSIALGNLGSSIAPSVVVANNGSNNVSVLVNPANGTGALATQTTYSTGSAPNSIALADLNNDGYADIVVTNHADATLGVLTGNANGSFNAQTTTAVATSPRQAVIADFNGDGNKDVAVASDTASAITVLFGTGTGSFAASPATIATGSTSVALTPVDLDGNGTPDLAVLNAGSASVAFYTDSTTVTGQLLNTAVTGTGTHQVDAIYPGDAYYATSTSTPVPVTARSVTTPAIVWSPSTLTQSYGTAIGAAVLNATTSGNIAGSFAYTAKPGSGTPTTITSSSVLAAGVYTITATFTPTNQSTYNTATSSITYTVTQIVPIITWSPSATAQVYGTAIGSGVLDATASGTQPGVITYSAQPTTGSATAITAASVLPASGYTLTATYTPTDTTDYQTVTRTQSYTVTQAVLTVTAQTASKAYGAVLPTLTSAITGYVNGDTSAVLTGSPAITTTAIQSSQAGPYTITAAIGSLAASNYTFTFVPATLTITPVNLNITVNNATKQYGAALPSFSGNTSGSVNGDVIGSSLIVVYSTTATTTTGVGGYSITASIVGSSAGSYTPVITPGTLSITPAPATITVANANSVYGATLPAFTGTITGAINNDTLTASYTTTATSASPIGTYPISATLTGASAANYSATIVPGTLTITTATLTVTIANASKQYGAALPTFSATATGLVNGDTLGTTILITYNTTATAASGIGSYPINGTLSGTSLRNYTATVVPAQLTVTTAATATILSTPSTTVPAGQSVTLTATVTSTAPGSPSGSVKFYNGTTLLTSTGVPLVSGTASYTTSALPNGYDSITAVYSGDAIFATSTSPALIVGVATTPDFSLAANPAASLTVTSGLVGTLTIEVAPVNGYTGTLSLSCGQLPQYTTCSFSPSTLTADGSNALLYTTLTVDAAQVAALQRPANPAAPMRAALLVIPAAFGILLILKRRRPLLRNLCSVAIFFLMLGALAGCGSTSQTVVGDAATGTSTISVIITDGNGTARTLSIALTIQ